MNNRIAILSIVAAGALLLAGCSGGSANGETPAEPSGTAGAGKQLKLAVIPKGTTHEFWKAIHAGAEAAAVEEGCKIEWRGPLKEDNKDEQIKIVDDFINQKVDGIVLAPLDDTAMRTPVDDAQKAGIPVVIIDSDVKTDTYVSFVATDNEKGGYDGGKKLAELLGGKGKVVMLRYQEGSASTMNREKGFLKAMAETPGIQVVSSDRHGGATTESAFAESQNLLNPLKKGDGLSIDGIFCPNESTTFGMLRALQDGGFAGKVKFVGFDSSPKLVDGMRAGHIHGLVLQNPYKMGYEGVKTMLAHIKGTKVERRVDTGVAVVTPENMDQEEMKKLLAPPQK